MAAIAWALHRVVPGGIQLRAASLPLWARLDLVVGEFGFYWGHRWMREMPLLWQFHSIHHGPVEVDWLVNAHAHPLDIVFVRLCGFVPMYALGLAQPLALKHNQHDVEAYVAGYDMGILHSSQRWLAVRLAGVDRIDAALSSLAPHPGRPHQPKLRFHVADHRCAFRY